jgi:hypothetical protein
MKNCRELNIPLCPHCNKTSTDTDCWITEWGLNFKFYINKNSKDYYNNTFKRLSGYKNNKYIYYWFQALKQFKPEIAEKFGKLFILL